MVSIKTSEAMFFILPLNSNNIGLFLYFYLPKLMPPLITCLGNQKVVVGKQRQFYNVFEENFPLNLLS